MSSKEGIIKEMKDKGFTESEIEQALKEAGKMPSATQPIQAQPQAPAKTEVDYGVLSYHLLERPRFQEIVKDLIEKVYPHYQDIIRQAESLAKQYKEAREGLEFSLGQSKVVASGMERGAEYERNMRKDIRRTLERLLEVPNLDDFVSTSSLKDAIKKEIGKYCEIMDAKKEEAEGYIGRAKIEADKAKEEAKKARAEARKVRNSNWLSWLGWKGIAGVSAVLFGLEICLGHGCSPNIDIEPVYYNANNFQDTAIYEKGILWETLLGIELDNGQWEPAHPAMEERLKNPRIRYSPDS